jgi:hypothetical protein
MTSLSEELQREINNPNEFLRIIASKLDSNIVLPEFVEYQGNWDPILNQPELKDGNSNPDNAIGHLYRCSTAATRDLGSGSQDWEVGDFAILNPNKIWERAPGAGAKVTSVNSQIGDVQLNTDDVSEGSTNKYFSDTLAKDAVVVNSLAGSETDQSPSVAAVNSSITPLVEYQEKDAQRNSFLKYYVYQNNAAVYADSSFAPTQDPSALLRDGWYFKNTTLNSKFNYYFYDSSNPTSYPAITLGETSIYTVMTFDAISDGPILTIYTVPLGDGNDAAPWYRSRLNYSGYATPGFTPELGKKYLIYGGQEPQVHPELPRIQLNQSGITTVGPLDPNEQVLTIAVGSNSAAAQNSNEWIIERAGCNATSLKYDFEFRILPVQQEIIEADDLASFPVGEAEKVYVAKDTNKLYRWDGAAYQELSPSAGGVVEFDQEVYVSKNGNDGTADGSLSSPYLTVKAAMASITDASPSKRYAIKVSSGNYSETGNLELKSNVFIMGAGKDVTRIGATSFKLSADFSGSADNRSGFSDCVLLNPCDFDWDSVSSQAGKLYFNHVIFNSTLRMVGFDNGIAQAQLLFTLHFGLFEISGINLLTIANRFYAACEMNQHPILPTIWDAHGGSTGQMTLTTSTNSFSRRCSMFARSFLMENLLVDGPVSYCDYTASSLGLVNSTANGGQLVPMNPTSAGANTALSNLSWPTSLNNPIIPNSSSSINHGDWSRQFAWSFSWISASTGTDKYLISYPSSFGAESDAGKNIGIYADGAGLASDINGGSIYLGTAAASGTGVQGRIEIDARELTMNNTKIVDLAPATASTDAVNLSQLTTAFSDRYRADSVALGNGVSTASVTFDSPLATANYTLTYSLVNLTDPNPKFLDILVTSKSTTGFSLKFHQNTDSSNYLLEYIAIIHS